MLLLLWPPFTIIYTDYARRGERKRTVVRQLVGGWVKQAVITDRSSNAGGGGLWSSERLG